MQWHWLTFHLLTVMAYGYEVLGGILIFYSSAVTENARPEDRKRVTHWIMFGLLAIVYIAFGIGIRHVEIQQNEQASQRSVEDRKELRGNRDRMDRQMDRVLSSFQVTYSQLASLSSEIGKVRNGLLQAIYKNDPLQIASLERQAQVAQQQADNLSHELLALTMAPQVADQLRGWQGSHYARQEDLRLREWEEHVHVTDGPQGQAGGKHFTQEEYNKATKAIADKWQAEYDKAEQQSQEELKGIIATADFVRRELLQRLPPERGRSVWDNTEEQEFAKAKNNPQVLSRENTANYLEDLARRVPPPK